MEIENVEKRRRHVGSACQACQSSKIKCDGARPSCGSCLKKDKECRYRFKNDKRRVSLRTAIDILSRRVSALSETLVKNGIELPPMNINEDGTLQDICSTLDITIPRLSGQGRNSAPAISHPDQVKSPARDVEWPEPALHTTDFIRTQDGVLISDDHLVDGSIPDWPWHMIESNSFFMSGPFNFALLDPDPSLALRDIVPASNSYNIGFNPHSSLVSATCSDDEPETDLIHQVSARFGALRLSSDGQLRYYGAATNYHLLAGFRHDDDTECSSTGQEVLNRLEQAGLAQDVPADLEQHLIEMYFRWHNPSHLIVDRALFLAARDNGLDTAASTGYASAVLLNAICAIGAAYEGRYHPAFITHPRSLADHFASRAKILLEVELNSPTISTVQALCILSSHEATRNQDAKTWLYGGMAMRLSFDLGLHIDCSPYVRAGVLTLDDARTRQSTFWSCVVLNHLSSFHFGRPFRIDSEEITVESPLQTNRYTTTGGHELDDANTTTVETQVGVPVAWMFLCDTMVPLMRKLYGSSSIPVTTLQEVSSSVTQLLEDWWTCLPPSLQIKDAEDTAPEIILLHMAYHHFRILIHRPWTSRRSQPWTGQGPGFRHARRMCSTSASNIAQLLIRYEENYSFRRMHSYAVNIIFSAALISLFDDIASKTKPALDATASDPTAGLSIFFRALDDLSRPFDSAARAREHLATIQRKWYSSEAVQSGPNPKRVNESAHSPPQSKRLRTRSSTFH